MTTEERNIVYAAAPPVEEAEAEQIPRISPTVLSRLSRK